MYIPRKKGRCCGIKIRVRLTTAEKTLLLQLEVLINRQTAIALNFHEKGIIRRRKLNPCILFRRSYTRGGKHQVPCAEGEVWRID